MLSTIMDMPLTLNHILWRAGKLYSKTPIVTQRSEGEAKRSTYGEVISRAQRLAGALAKYGIQAGDRVATFAWNTQHHLECYLAIPCMGAVLHTLNVRLFSDQLEYIINHANDRIIFCDRSVLPTLESLANKIPSIELIVLMNDGPSPTGPLTNTVDYEDFLATGDLNFDWPEIDERSAAAMCYTSGTTGNPKGVVYSHRSIMLHSLVEALQDNIGISERDVVLYAVPMFHANAWGLPYACALTGASQVLTDRYLEAERLTDLLDKEQVTLSAGVPTIWLPVLELLNNTQRSLPSLRDIICGGSAAPPSLIEGFRNHGINLIHAWGMTETSPLGSVSRLKGSLETLSEDKQQLILWKQGIIAQTVECRLIDMDTGRDVPWDGAALGELQVRGPYITGGYYNDPDESEKFIDGWLRTGDVATIDPEGYIQLVDRTKDLVKSGGEWISSVELENHLMAHPAVLEAAVVGIAHPRWQERPVAAIVPRPGSPRPEAEELREFLATKVAKWWLPDEFIFLKSIPKTSVGKFAKLRLRAELGQLVTEDTFG